ncbi:hypothetical protein GPX89_01940 [Nocardia sp. ET3-3]|uniref:Treble clef zinc finger domain-containing protein n=1 Tax=Nocardia terrae TaxID=2675851 RepID=A0A7K1UNT0_9NOCA|nr:hypothetical protein [Nocardia terrae]
MSTTPPVGRSLADRAPTVAEEWHPTLNGDVTPRDVFAGSDFRAWWQCKSCGHQWASKLQKRVQLGRGCPECAVARRARTQATPQPGKSLADLLPHLAAEWHPTRNELTPSDVMPGSGAKAWWLCPVCGNEWETVVTSRAREGRGCRKCWHVRRGILRATPKPGHSFADEHPLAAAEWHPTHNGDCEPSNVRPYSKTPRWWICAAGHEWEVAPADRTRNEQCPECAKSRRSDSKRTPKPGRSLADLYPEIAAEWHPTLNGKLTAADVNPGGRQKRWWQCRANEHAWLTPPYKRTMRGDDCPRCSLIGVSARQLRLEYELAAAGLPVSHGHPPIPVNRRRPVRCDIVIPSLNLIIEYDGVRFHRGLDRQDRAQSAALTSAGWTVLRVRELPLHGLGGDEVFVSPTESIKSVALKVLGSLEKRGYVADRLNDYRTSADTWGESDARKAIHQHRTVSLATKNPTLAAEFDPAKNDGVRADQVHPGTHTRFVWSCSNCGHDWTAAVSTRASGHGCPRCRYRKVAEKLSRPEPGKSFADKYPTIALQWHPNRNGTLTPDQVRPASNKLVWWICHKGHEWSARVARRRSLRCPDCKL